MVTVAGANEFVKGVLQMPDEFAKGVKLVRVDVMHVCTPLIVTCTVSFDKYDCQSYKKSHSPCFFYCNHVFIRI